MAEQQYIKRAWNFKDLTGKRFGNLTVICYAGHRRYTTLWQCRCDCGTVRNYQAGNLVSGHSRGCSFCKGKRISKGRRRHGLTHTPIYNIWSAMKRRCLNPNVLEYKYYGAKGIMVCPQWVGSFEQFLQDMGPRPTEDHSIDRIDNNGPYSPSNCRWATPKEQARNKSNSHKITVNGETKTIAEWAETIGISQDVISDRLRRGDSGPRLFRTVRQIHAFHYQEQDVDIKELSERSGIPPNVLRHRLSAGWPMARAIADPVKRQHKTGMGNSPERVAWSSMKLRCKKSLHGVSEASLCDRWRNSFLDFLEDVGKKPFESAVLGRIRPELGYQPANCRWMTQNEALQRASDIRIVLGGKEERLRDVAERTGIPYNRLYVRLKTMHWDPERVVTTPYVNKRRSGVRNIQ